MPAEWVTFPSGKLSHSFEGYYSEGDVSPDLSFGEFVSERRRGGGGASSPSGAMKNRQRAMTGSTNVVVDMYDFAFRTDSTSLSDLTNPEALTVLFALVLLMRRLKKFFLPRFSSIGRRLGRAAHGPGWEDDNADRIVKFGEYVHRLCYHAAVSVYGAWYFRDKSWWDASRGGRRTYG
jgi:hypothetical protein